MMRLPRLTGNRIGRHIAQEEAGEGAHISGAFGEGEIPIGIGKLEGWSAYRVGGHSEADPSECIANFDSRSEYKVFRIYALSCSWKAGKDEVDSRIAGLGGKVDRDHGRLAPRDGYGKKTQNKAHTVNGGRSLESPSRWQHIRDTGA